MSDLWKGRQILNKSPFQFSFLGWSSFPLYANDIHYFSGRVLGSCIIYHRLTCRNSMIICTHSKSQAIFTRPDYNINLFQSFLPSWPSRCLPATTSRRRGGENPSRRFSHQPCRAVRWRMRRSPKSKSGFSGDVAWKLLLNEEFDVDLKYIIF